MAQFVDNVLLKMRNTPEFRPSNVSAFGDWSIEAGDIILVENGGKVEKVPVFSSNLSWNGSASSEFSNSGSKKREIQEKQQRESYGSAAGYSRQIKELHELYDSFGVALENTQATLETYVAETEDLKTANVTLTARVDDTVAGLALVVNEVDGISNSVATLQADIISLRGSVGVEGDLTVSDGTLRVRRDIEAINGTVVAHTVAASNIFTLGGERYEKQNITSTTGVVFALGIA